MQKTVKVTAIVAGAAGVLLAALFVVIPLVSSAEAEARLGEALAQAGIPAEMWYAERVYYVPVLGRLVVERFEIGSGLAADKITMAIKTNRADADDTGIILKSLSVKGLSMDTAAFLEHYLLGKLGRNNWILAAAVRQFVSLPAVRPEYRISTLKLNNAVSGNSCKSDLVIHMDDLFVIQAAIGFSFPRGFNGRVGFASLNEDVQLHSLALTYTDKSFVDHVFTIAGLPGGRKNAAELLNSAIVMIAKQGGIDAERFVRETVGFFRKPVKLELKANLDPPMFFQDIANNPFAAKLSLSINGKRPFTTAENEGKPSAATDFNMEGNRRRRCFHQQL